MKEFFKTAILLAKQAVLPTSPVIHTKTIRRNHFAIVGGGVGGSAFMNSLVQELSQLKTPANGAIFDDGTDPWHQKTSPVPLLNHQSVGDFGQWFIDWMHRNRTEFINLVEENGKGLATEWLRENRTFILNASLEEFRSDWQRRFPRAVMGLYLDDLVKEAMELAKQNKIEISKISERVISAEQDEYGSFAIGTNEHTTQSDNLFIGTGMPPPPPHDGVIEANGYFATMYENDNFNKLIHYINYLYLENGNKPVDINVVGLGPSGLDVIYWLYQNCNVDPEFHKKINVSVISSTIKPRPPAISSGKTPAFDPKFKESYQTADELKADMEMSLKRAQEEGYTEGESRTIVLHALKKTVQTLPKEEHAAFSGRKYAPIYLGKLSNDAEASYSSIEKMEKMGVLKIIKGRVDNQSLTENEDGMVEFTYKTDDEADIKATPGIFINCASTLFASQERTVKESWLGHVLGKENAHTVGLNSYWDPSYKFKPMVMDPQFPAIEAAARESAKTVARNIAEAYRTSPEALTAFAAPSDIKDLVATNTVNFLEDLGLNPRDFKLIHQGHCSEHYQHKTKPIVLKIDVGSREETRLQHPSILHPLANRDFGPELHAGRALISNLQVSLYPLVETDGVTDEHIASLMADMEEAGHVFFGNIKSNVGLYNEVPFIIDRSAVITKEAFDKESAKLKSITDTYGQGDKSWGIEPLDAARMLEADYIWGINNKFESPPAMTPEFWAETRENLLFRSPIRAAKNITPARESAIEELYKNSFGVSASPVYAPESLIIPKPSTFVDMISRQTSERVMYRN